MAAASRITFHGEKVATVDQLVAELVENEAGRRVWESNPRPREGRRFSGPRPRPCRTLSWTPKAFGCSTVRLFTVGTKGVRLYDRSTVPMLPDPPNYRPTEQPNAHQGPAGAGGMAEGTGIEPVWPMASLGLASRPLPARATFRFPRAAAIPR